ncbi:MAG TPA: neutral/alkaline non-lysosomal ceramidase N-terminal domain-containing protein [Dehalococcoidia bacterium]|nr:neutral/alkaline non-lysosomal ceramidase N-terminal domain-containing protein [Dehalococcoidia bacterium]
MRDNPPQFNVGASIYDITGPAAELAMMGYARPQQLTAGVHTRLWSRAFVIESPANGRRVAFVSADLGMIFQAAQQEVVRRLQRAFPGFYSDQNVLLSATHTHSGPGGFSHYTLYNLSTLGFDKQNFETIVSGIFESIARAHANLEPGRIYIASGDLEGSSINRSPTAYERNPAPDRAGAPDTDKLMTVLKLEAEDGREIGCINWFAVHCTSMGNRNHLISGDNKGYASYLFERLKQSEAQPPFVAAFAQSNEGDVSPNINGGEDGGGRDDFESTQISGAKQFEKALELYQQASEEITGPIDYRHRYLDMSNIAVEEQWSGVSNARTCPAAIGQSMLAGAEDGPGIGREGASCAEMKTVWPFLHCQPECEPASSGQWPKPIVIRSNWTNPPLSPEVLPLQIVRIGGLALAALPFEATTMAGRRLRKVAADRLASDGVKYVVIAGLANAYSGYLVTQEEYEAQQYEGASTHFGRWTLAACQQEFDRLAGEMAAGEPAISTAAPPAVDPKPRDLRAKVFGLFPGVIFDAAPPFKDFGSVSEQPHRHYRPEETARATFWGGHPKSGLLTQSSFVEAQRLDGRQWQTVAADRDPETRFIWKRVLTSFAKVSAEWQIPPGTTPGTYRLLVRGYAKPFLRSPQPYAGFSRTFVVSKDEA